MMKRLKLGQILSFVGLVGDISCDSPYLDGLQCKYNAVYDCQRAVSSITPIFLSLFNLYCVICVFIGLWRWRSFPRDPRGPVSTGDG